MLHDSLSEHTRRLLILYVPKEHPDDMPKAILRLYGDEKSAQDITTFYTMRQGAHQTVTDVSLRLDETFEKVQQIRITDGDPLLGKHFKISK